jgi:hypothetical protein
MDDAARESNIAQQNRISTPDTLRGFHGKVYWFSLYPNYVNSTRHKKNLQMA